MNDLEQKKAACWNKRLRGLMDEHHLKQASLANAMNKKYAQHDTRFGQKDVSRWLNVGSKAATKNGVIGFPKYETMLLIADFFSVDIGYLTGETDFRSFDMEKAIKYLGVTGEAPIKIIRDITRPDSESPLQLTLDMRHAISQFIGAHEFKELFLHIFDLYRISPVSGVPDYIKYDHFEGAMGYAQDVNDSIGLNRFKVYESFFAMLDKLYPYASTSDFLIDEE